MVFPGNVIRFEAEDKIVGIRARYFRLAETFHQHLTGYIVFSPASFEKEYSVESRTYRVFSDNKAFQPKMRRYPPSLRPLWTALIPMSVWNSICPRSMAGLLAGRSSGAI